MSHTPGPWIAKTNPKGQQYVASDTTKSAVVEAGALSKDDAALVAAAPELLDILARIVRAHESGNNGAVSGEAILCRQFVLVARAAIAKARAATDKATGK